MREIKFRGRCLESGTWIYGSLFNSIWRKSADGSRVCYIFPDNMLADDNGGGDCWEDFAEVAEQYEVDPSTVGQYTGLHDKEGGEIYEGDIMVLVAQRAESVFLSLGWEAVGPEYRSILAMTYNIGQCAFGFCRPREAMDANPDICGLAVHNRCRIIGNIHDNPELLKTE